MRSSAAPLFVQSILERIDCIGADIPLIPTLSGFVLAPAVCHSVNVPLHAPQLAPIRNSMLCTEPAGSRAGDGSALGGRPRSTDQRGGQRRRHRRHGRFIR